jgi:hypothetical protein
MKKKQIHFVLILMVFIQLIYLTIINDNLKSSQAEYSYEPEWVSLGNYMFFRRSAAFFFYDDDVIEVLVLSEIPNPNNYSCIVQVNKAVIVESNAELVLQRSYKEIQLRFFILKCQLVRRPSYLKANIKLHVKNNKASEITKSPIDVLIKSKALKTQTIRTRGKFLLCSKYNFLVPSDFDDFKKWIELNIKFGYEQIVLFNFSVPSNSDFNGLFAKYKGIVIGWIINSYYITLEGRLFWLVLFGSLLGIQTIKSIYSYSSIYS